MTQPPMISWKQQAHLGPESWFLNTIFQEKEPGLLGEITGSRPGLGNIQDELQVPCSGGK